jgi:hypothetical protein
MPNRKRSTRRLQTAQPMATATLKHYQADDSIFVDDAYLIKGVAGCIFWKLVRSDVQ